MSSVYIENGIEASPMNDAGPEAVDKHAAKSHSDKAEVATIDMDLVRAILSALASINNARKRVDDHDNSKETPGLADSSSSSSCEGLREILARAHAAKDAIMAQHRARIANTSRIRPLLATLPPLFIEKLPVPSCPPLKKFELFEKLPKEIRIMIYELMVAEPRCIKLFEGHRPGDRHIHPWNSNVEGQSRHPAIMHISREARQEGLRYYTICHDRRRLYIELTLPEPHETWRTEEPRLVNRMVLHNEGLRNTYFINFKLDYFDHGQTKFTPSPYQLAGEYDFNFAVDVLQRVKHVHQRPCYENAQKGFRAIAFDTLCTTLMFRHKLWRDLRHVTLSIEVYTVCVTQESLIWANFRQMHERRARKYMVTQPFSSAWLAAAAKLSSRGSRSTTEEMGPVQFELHYKWKKQHDANCICYDPVPTQADHKSIEIHDPDRREDPVDSNKAILEECLELYRSRGD